MKRTNSFSLYAFIIALLVHLIIILILILLDQFKPIPPIQPKEERFKLSLDEYPNNQTPSVQKIFSTPTPQQKQSNRMLQTQPKPQIQVPVPLEPSFKPSPQIVEQKPTITLPIAPPAEKAPTQKSSGLYSILSKPDGSAETLKSAPKTNSNIQQLYGDKFDELSAGEREYLKQNLNEISNIAQKTLNRVGAAKIPNNYHTQSFNYYEFYLYPDGSISDIKFLLNGEMSILDDTSRITIEVSAHKFPRPKEKTLIRFKTRYSI